VRILRTSGTTGLAKRIRNSRLVYDAKIVRWIVLAGFNRRSRLLITMSLSVQGMYSCASACLRAGGTLVSGAFADPRDIAHAILEHGVTVLILSPVQIKQLLDALPDGFAKPPTLMLCSFGAAVSAALRERALAALATEVIDMYGSNETGFISSIGSSRDEGISTVWPGARVEVVDEQDHPLPHGQMGRIRARTPEMIHGYSDDPETTDRMFKDGWFYPGDLGILHGSRRLQVIGRSDDLLNLGGRKLPPEALEQVIIKSAVAGDVGACSVRNAEGIEELVIALVDAPGDERHVLERLTTVIAPFRVGGFRAVKLPTIPRNAAGKIQRDLLRTAVVEAMRSARPVTL
jgi:acyl-coenzyme A synthetase/AMP-(fatty) acid ligase